MDNDINLQLLTLQDIEDCANRVMEKLNSEKMKRGIRDKSRQFKESLICRYCYYKVARSILSDDTKRGRSGRESADLKNYKFSLEQIGDQIEVASHASVINALKSFNQLLTQKNQWSVAAWEAMQDEVYKCVIKKDKDAKLAKRVLLGGI